MYAAFGKDESLPKRKALLGGTIGAMIYFFTGEVSGSSPGWPTPGKRIEASDSFMHAPLGSGGDIAQLVELRSCNWVVAITGWMSNCPGGNDSILYLMNRWLTFSK